MDQDTHDMVTAYARRNVTSDGCICDVEIELVEDEDEPGLVHAFCSHDNYCPVLMKANWENN